VALYIFYDSTHCVSEVTTLLHISEKNSRLFSRSRAVWARFLKCSFRAN